MRLDYPIVKDLVLVGGGHAHALVARMWGMDPVPGVRLTLINPGPAAPYTGMLPGLIAGHYARDEIMIDLIRLGRFAGARVILDRAVRLERDARAVILGSGRRVGYDVLSVDIGIGSDLPGVPGFAENAVAAKPLGGFVESWEAYVARAQPDPRVVIIGGGVGGIELALASAHRLAGAAPQITVIERAGAVLPGIGRGARDSLLRAVGEAKIRLVTGAEVIEVRADAVALTTGEVIGSDFTLAVAGGRAQGWLAETGLDCHDGFLRVGPTLQTSDPLIFAVGDCAHMDHAPRPKAGVFAVRQAPVLVHNLRLVLREIGPLKPYHPQRDYLKLVSTGGRVAVADKMGLRSGGGWLWSLKDRIDRKFMGLFAGLAPMATQVLPKDPLPGLAEAMGAKPLCGGCGSKLASEGLTAALSQMPRPIRPEIVMGAGDDAAVIREGQGFRMVTTDHLRSFTLDAGTMARITALHALSDIWAMGAEPTEALVQIILPRMSAAKASAELAEIMAAAGQVFARAGVDVIGGHSSTGAELTIGFTVTGRGTRVLTKTGARAGDALILTKPIGTGVIMAAEMAMAGAPGLILGEAVAAALAVMLESSAEASALLAPAAHAMTDVTGFGLAGHLVEMLDGLDADLIGVDIPLMHGARELAAAGQGSSLLASNMGATAGRVFCADPVLAALLHDPQTSGGLLAAVPAGGAGAAVRACQDAGIAAVIIGRVQPGTGLVRVV
jgi:selenide,water dikinase